MISTVVKAGLRAPMAAKSTQIQAKRFLYPRIKMMIVRRKGDNEAKIPEKIMYCVIFMLTMYSYPFYVMSNLEHYRGGRKED